MFDTTLLIINSDYMPQRRELVLHILKKGFLIQVRRIVQFSPEQAAEFYKDVDDDTFMTKVILLSKGRSEAFLLTKENAAEDLVNVLICYFCSSNEMEHQVHVTRRKENAFKEISFVFPNYICDPIDAFKRQEFCTNSLTSAVIDKMYDIYKDNLTESWDTELSDWLMKANKNVPIMSNTCSYAPLLRQEEKAQQASYRESTKKGVTEIESTPTPSSFMSAGSSMIMSSSSCITCSDFAGDEQREIKIDQCLEYIKSRTVPLRKPKTEEQIETIQPDWDESSETSSAYQEPEIKIDKYFCLTSVESKIKDKEVQTEPEEMSEKEKVVITELNVVEQDVDELNIPAPLTEIDVIAAEVEEIEEMPTNISETVLETAAKETEEVEVVNVEAIEETAVEDKMDVVDTVEVKMEVAETAPEAITEASENIVAVNTAEGENTANEAPAAE